MIRRIRVMRQLREDQSGVSLTELLVASVLTMAIVAMVATMFVQTTRITTTSLQTTGANSNASNVANEVTAVLRVATNLARSGTTPLPAIASGGASSLQLYSLSNTSPTSPAPVRVTFTLASGTVTETRCTGTSSGGFWSFTTCASSQTRTLGTGVQSGTGIAPLFSYLDAGGDAITVSGSLSDEQRANVASVTVAVTTRVQQSTAAPVIITNTVSLRNLGLDVDS
jgi:Tfp pilus assembly protein PilW